MGMSRTRSWMVPALAGFAFVVSACGRAPDSAAPTTAAPVAAAPAASRLDRVRPALADVDRLFTAFVEQAHAPGATWGVILDGELVHSGSTGFRDVAAQAPIDRDTVFRIASMTKSFTALAILKLRDEGRLALDDPAERHVPELASLAYPTADSPTITVRHLLTHSEGFPEDNPWGDRQLARTDAEFDEMMRGGIPFSTAPGTAYEYSNYGFALLGRIVSNVSGQPYADYVAEHLLGPLGLTSTTLEAADVPADRLAHGYRWQDGTWLDEPALPDGAFGAMGGMLTSMTDLGRYVAFHLDAWPPRDDHDDGPVRRASVREMQQGWRLRPASVRRAADGSTVLMSGAYGYGLRVTQTCEFGQVVAHTGGLPGYGSVMTWIPDYGLGVFAMVNLTYTSASGVANDALSLIVRTAGLAPRQPVPSPALVEARDAVNRLLAGWDDGLAAEIAADNLYPDESMDRRRAAIETLVTEHGACRPDDAFDVENALRGQWTMTCDRGALLVAITLAPTMPPKVQHLDVRSVEPGAPTRQPTCGN